MYHIRPYQIFGLVDQSPSDRVVQVQLPPRRGAGGTTLLETCLLLAASKAVDAKRIFEFGTFLGSTTLNLALSVPDDGRVFTSDLDEQCLASTQQDPADAPLTQIHIASKRLDFMDSSVADRVKMLTGNSITFDFSPWLESMDMSFIDGGHDLLTVQADTEHALAMSRQDTAACILWHDYGNVEYPDLTTYLDRLSRRMPIFHVEDTRICLWFNNAGKGLQSRLLDSIANHVPATPGTPQVARAFAATSAH